MKIKLKKPLENIIQIYTYYENIKGEVPAVEGKIVTQDTYETILPKKIKKVFETLNKMFDIGIVVSQKIAPNSIKSEISNILLDKSRPKDEKIEAIIKFSNILSYKIFNKNYDAKKNNWYRLVWKTPIEDMKKRHFKCSDIRTNSKGRVEYILFEEI